MAVAPSARRGILQSRLSLGDPAHRFCYSFKIVSAIGGEATSGGLLCSCDGSGQEILAAGNDDGAFAYLSVLTEGQGKFEACTNSVFHRVEKSNTFYS